ncbi:protein regulator of cytokinesis 1-like [Drosophila obscura]|uniref:protein regulator of cytokinesis 1-like n=1 Tax=Drosophila obscura TaxID=7282 RepID=UPI001BB216DF|nr:protein regulator of cytokinesis 1-like [Drosophila obscura]
MSESAAMKQKILAMTAAHVDQLYVMWCHMFDAQTCENYLHQLKEHAEAFYNDLLAESREKQTAIEKDIAALQAEESQLHGLLHGSVHVEERPQHVPLAVWQLRLEHSVEQLREELPKRRAEIAELLLQQEPLCQELGVLPLPLLTDPLSLPQELTAFREHLDQLQAERVARTELMKELRQSIEQELQQLENEAAERRWLNEINQDLTPETFERLRTLHQRLADQRQEQREHIDAMREKILALWERLQETDEPTMRRVRDATEYTEGTCRVLQEELQRCQLLLSGNLKTIIQQLRLEIHEWWDRTLKSRQERLRFASYYTDWYNEELLELHELQLDDLKGFYSNHKGIFELYASRAKLLARMEVLEAKSKDPMRFQNRGGQLLKEERERRDITFRLPKMELQITELVQAYEVQCCGPFLVHGENILELMAGQRMARNQQNSAPRKTPCTKLKAPAAAGTLLNMSNVSCRKPPATPIIKSTGIPQKHKPLHPSVTSGSGQKAIGTGCLKSTSNGANSALQRVRLVTPGTRTKKNLPDKSPIKEPSMDVTDENQTVIGDSFGQFTPSSRSSLLPVSRNILGVLHNNSSNNSSVATVTGQEAKQQPRGGKPFKLPTPRSSLMWLKPIPKH